MKYTMKKDLLALLSEQWVTPQDALYLCGCMSLAQRVSEWRRKGYEFAQETRKVGRSKFAAYMLTKAPKV